MSSEYFPSIAIIILNWNGWKDTLECLETVYQIDYPNYRVIVTDNASTNESVLKFHEYANGGMKIDSVLFSKNFISKRRRLIEIRQDDIDITQFTSWDFLSKEDFVLVRTKRNLGFSGGNNVSMKYVHKFLKADYILLLNNDTVVSPDFLSKLVLIGEKNKKIGAVGSKIFFYDRSDEVQNVGGGYNMWTGRRIHYSITNCNKGVLKVGYISGACILIKSEVLDIVGYLDTDYFLYVEDIDWCYRIKQKGYDLYIDLSSEIWHKVSASTSRGEISDRSTSFIIRNDIRFMRKFAKLYHYPTFLVASFFVLIKSPIFRSKTKLRIALKTGLNTILSNKPKKGS